MENTEKKNVEACSVSFSTSPTKTAEANDTTSPTEKKKKKSKGAKKPLPVDEDGVENQVFKFQYVHDTHGLFRFVSEDVTDVVGHSKTTLQGTHYHNITPDEHREHVDAKTQETINTHNLSLNFDSPERKRDKKDSNNESEANEEPTELVLKDNMINAYECFLLSKKTGKKTLVRIYEKPIIEELKVSEKVVKIVKGVQGVVVLSDKINEFEQEMCSILINKSMLWLSLVNCEHNKRLMLSADPEAELRREIEEHKFRELAEKMLTIYENKIQYLNPRGDKWASEGKPKFREQLLFFMKKYLPINFILPAFPFKSANKYKTLGHIPDKGEMLALEVIHEFCQEIDNLYEYGVVFNLVSDGRVFADIMKIPDKDVDDYDGLLREKYPQFTKYIKFFDLDYFLNTDKKHDEAREKLLKLFGRSTAKIQQKIETDDEYKKMYLGFSKFILEDLFFIMDDDDKNKISTENTLNMSRMQIKNEVKAYAKQIMRRNDAYSKMIENLFPLYIRLSIHAHNNAGPKFAIRLLPMDKVAESLVGDKNMHIPTPWHNVVVQTEDGKYMLMKKYRVKHLKNCELIYDNEGMPSHYIIKTTSEPIESELSDEMGEEKK